MMNLIKNSTKRIEKTKIKLQVNDPIPDMNEINLLLKISHVFDLPLFIFMLESAMVKKTKLTER